MDKDRHGGRFLPSIERREGVETARPRKKTVLLLTAMLGATPMRLLAGPTDSCDVLNHLEMGIAPA